MYFDEEVKVENTSMMANAYRNLNRPRVDALFQEASSLESSLYTTPNISKKNADKLKAQIEGLREDAKQLWRQIVTTANTL